MGDFDSLYLSLDSDLRLRGEQFERVCKWFLENDPVYSRELRKVWLWKDWPGRWGSDAGIDLVAENRNGELWAIQAKAYDPKYRISKKDVDKFLAESGRKVFNYRILIAPTDRIDRTGERTIQQQEKRSSFFRLNDLRAAALDWPASPAQLRPAKRRKPARPRSHQAEAIRDVVKGFKTSDRGQVIMACGIGKTLTGLFIAEKLKCHRTLVLLPSLSLLKQTLNEWRANCTEDFASLPVCSDDTVVTTDDTAVAHASDLGVPVTTDPRSIAAFLRRRSGPLVVFSTYQSSPQIEAAFKLGHVPRFDLILADEAHRVAGSVSSDFATVLDSRAIKSNRRLFMTATPRYFTGRVLKAAQEADFEVASMDDAAKFGPVFHRLSFGEAIERDLLTDYQVAIVGVDDATYREWAKRGALVTRDGKQVDSAATLAGQIGLAKAMRKYDLRRVISFHSRVKRAREFATSMPEVIDWMPARQRPKGALWADVATGEMPAGDRYVLLQHLARLDEGERGLLANARCLSEGVDVPTLDGVAFIDPRRSEVDIVQAVGRAIRKSDAKALGTIVIPVFIDTEEDPEVALDSSVFKPVWDVLRALRSHDDELGRQLDTLRREMGSQVRTPDLPPKIYTDIPKSVGAAFSNAFRIRLVEQTTASWEFWFGLLERYVERTGDARVPASHQERGQKLGAWVVGQRHNRAKRLLSTDREARLAALPGWIWNTYGAMWEQGFQRLKQYVEVYGDALVPHDFTFDGFNLGRWVVARRAQYANGNLPESLAAELERLPGWIWNTYDAAWDAGYTGLKRYVDLHGTARVPQGLKFEGANIGGWVIAQRGRRRSGKLEPPRVALLEELPGWTWDPFADDWEEGFSRLDKYASDHGDARVELDFAEEGFRLGKWVAKQRAAYQAEKMPLDRISRLESVPGWVWNSREEQWSKGFQRLRDHLAAGGSAAPTHTTTVDGYPLGGWVIQQRAAYRKGELSQRRIDLLNEIPGWSWDPAADSWSDGFSRLREYVKLHGHAAVPTAYVVDGFPLGRWIHSQRHAHVKNQSDPEWDRRLEQLPGWLWRPKSDAWEVGYFHLQNFLRIHGNLNIPKDCIADGYRLGVWVATQRGKRRAGKLKLERKMRLEALPGWLWDPPKPDAFEVGLAHLTRYVEEYGSAAVPSGYVLDGYALGSWVSNQRSKRRRDAMTPEHRDRLEGIPGWAWHTGDAAWEEAFELANRYAAAYGHAQIPTSYVVDGFKLGRWVNGQRVRYARGTLRPDRREKLESLPGWAWRAGLAKN